MFISVLSTVCPKKISGGNPLREAFQVSTVFVDHVIPQHPLEILQFCVIHVEFAAQEDAPERRPKTQALLASRFLKDAVKGAACVCVQFVFTKPAPRVAQSSASQRIGCFIGKDALSRNRASSYPALSIWARPLSVKCMRGTYSIYLLN